MALLTWWLTRGDDHVSTGGYFLAGRSLAFPLMAGSLLLTHLSTTHRRFRRSPEIPIGRPTAV